MRKSSNIDFFIKLLLQLGYELLLSEMQKNWGVTHFVSEIRYLKGHPNFEKSVFLTRYGSIVCMSKILQMNLSNRIFYATFYMSGSIKQIKTTSNISLSKFNLKRQILQTLTAASWRDSMLRGLKNGKILNFLH